MSESHSVRGSRFSRWLNLEFTRETNGSIKAILVPRSETEGPPAHVHGGISSSLIDEAMGVAVWMTGRRALAVNINFNLKRAVPLGVEITVVGRVERSEGRKTFTTGEIYLPDGTVAVEGTGIYVDAPTDIVPDSFSFEQLND